MKVFFDSNPELLTEKHHKVGIVSHGMFLKCLSAQSFDPEKKKLIGASDMKNCEICPCPNY